jgi:hypothetical protein
MEFLLSPALSIWQPLAPRGPNAFGASFHWNAVTPFHARRLSAVKNMSIYVVGFLTWIAILLLCDPAFLHCNRWDQTSCIPHSTRR